jgi:hypothetical protein
MRLTVALCTLIALALPACSKKVEAPYDAGVCWHMVQLKDGKVRFNKLAEHVTTIENCAVDLESMRLRFTRLGSQQSQMIGAYQGQFLFLQPEGIFIGQTLTGARYVALVRTGDGRLAKVGMMPIE